MWKICFFFSRRKNLGTGKSKRVEADFQAQEQAEGNQPQNILCFAFPPSALNALPREDQITVIRGNNSQSGVFFGDALALSKITLVLHGEARVSINVTLLGTARGLRGGVPERGERPGGRGWCAASAPLRVKRAALARGTS